MLNLSLQQLVTIAVGVSLLAVIAFVARYLLVVLMVIVGVIAGLYVLSLTYPAVASSVQLLGHALGL